MTLLLEKLMQSCDLVIIDSTPLLTVSDSLPLVEVVSGTVMVARINETSKDAVRRLQSVVANAGGVLLGTVVTGATATALYGGYGYGYHQDAAVNGRARPAAPPPRPAAARPKPEEIPPTVTERLRKRGENGAELAPPKKPGLPHKPPERKKSGWFS
jgi:hypothetical protein